MSPSWCDEFVSKVLISEVCQSFSAGVVLYADIRGELGGESGMKRLLSTICTLEDESYEVDVKVLLLGCIDVSHKAQTDPSSPPDKVEVSDCSKLSQSNECKPRNYTRTSLISHVLAIELTDPVVIDCHTPRSDSKLGAGLDASDRRRE